MSLDLHEEYRAALALRHTPGIGPRTWQRLGSHYPSLVEAAADARAWHELGLTSARQAEAFRSRAWREGADAEYRAAHTTRMRVLVLSDPRYPDRLREIPDPPLYLYYQGRIGLLQGPAVAVVGARQCSAYGLDAARQVAGDLARAGIAVVSGLAHGIDRQAHQAALAEVGSTIAVLGTGLDRVYPAANADVWREVGRRGLLLSEFAPGTTPEARNFPVRNRVISGLSLGVLVAEAAHDSGSLITARLAMEQGRDVFALPGPLSQPTFGGCHDLIRQGAMLVTGADDIISELRPLLGPLVESPVSHQAKEAVPATRHVPAPASPPVTPPKPMPQGLTSQETGLLEALGDGERRHIDELIRTSGQETAVVSRTLLQLELKRLVRQWPGMFYSRV